MYDDIDNIEFSLLCPEIIRGQSVVKIEHADIYDKDRMPKFNGLSDIRLGTTDRQYNCYTCKGDVSDCPGHFGHLELSHPMYHPSFMKMVYRILMNVCFDCSRLLVPEEKLLPIFLKMSNKKRHRFVSGLVKPRSICKYCADKYNEQNDGKEYERKQPKFTFEGHKIFVEHDDEEKKYLDSKYARRILKKIMILKMMRN